MQAPNGFRSAGRRGDCARGRPVGGATAAARWRIDAGRRHGRPGARRHRRLHRAARRTTGQRGVAVVERHLVQGRGRRAVDSRAPVVVAAAVGRTHRRCGHLGHPRGGRAATIGHDRPPPVLRCRDGRRARRRGGGGLSGNRRSADPSSIGRCDGDRRGRGRRRPAGHDSHRRAAWCARRATFRPCRPKSSASQRGGRKRGAARRCAHLLDRGGAAEGVPGPS